MNLQEKLLKATEIYYKLAQKPARQMVTVEATPGIYQDVLTEAGLWGENGQKVIINSLQKAGALTTVDVYIVVHPDMTISLKVRGHHPRLAAAAQLIQKTLAPAMSKALKNAVNKNIAGIPSEPIEWLWISGVGFE